jgi:hypothetical protein
MLLKSRASPGMLPFSLCNKKRLAIRHINTPLSATKLSIPSYDIGKYVGLRTYQHPLVVTYRHGIVFQKALLSSFKTPLYYNCNDNQTHCIFHFALYIFCKKKKVLFIITRRINVLLFYKKIHRLKQLIAFDKQYWEILYFWISLMKRQNFTAKHDGNSRPLQTNSCIMLYGLNTTCFGSYTISHHRVDKTPKEIMLLCKWHYVVVHHSYIKLISLLHKYCDSNMSSREKLKLKYCAISERDVTKMVS